MTWELLCSFYVRLVTNGEATVTVAFVVFLLAIIAGPMNWMKYRYKVLVLLIAVSILGAYLNRIVKLFGSAYDDADVLMIAQSIIFWSRLAGCIQSAYILLMWDWQCKRIAEQFAARQRQEELSLTTT